MVRDVGDIRPLFVCLHAGIPDLDELEFGADFKSSVGRLAMSSETEGSEPPALVLPTGPFWSSCGPADGPIRESHDLPSCIVMHPADPADASAPSSAMGMCGIAYAVGYMADDRGLISVFRLTFGKSELPGRWTCVGRRFVELGEAAEYVGEGRCNMLSEPFGWVPEPY
jgi:hypothetical protein